MQLPKTQRPIWLPFAYLVGFTMLGIFLHELGHHMLGVPSMLGLSRNWPLVPVTTANREAGIVGTLAGPLVNLVLGYIAWLLYRYGKGAARTAGLYAGIANLFLAASGAVINLVVDALSRSPGNDLEQVSYLLSWNWLILPALMTALAAPGLVYLFREWGQNQWGQNKPRPLGRAATIFGAWLVAGLVLMTLDSALQIRFTLR